MTERPRPSASVRAGSAREDWNARYSATELVWTAEPNRHFVSEVEELPPGRALDLACGEGRNAVWLAQRGWRVTGIDFSDVALAKAERLAAGRGVDVEWVLGDVVEQEPEAGAFDLVAVLYLQLPEDALTKALHGAASALAPGGTLIVLGHDTSNLNEGYGGPKDARVLFTPDEVVAALGGLTVERAEQVRRSVALEQTEAVAIDAFVRARRPC